MANKNIELLDQKGSVSSSLSSLLQTRPKHYGTDADPLKDSELPLNFKKSPAFLIQIWSISWLFYGLLGLSACIGGIMFGYDLGIISGVLLFLDKETHYTCFQRELLVSGSLAGALAGTIFGGPLLDCFGRRRTLLLNILISALGVILSAVANGFVMLVMGRFIVGISLSLAVVGECLLVSELSHPDHRGKLLSLNELGITFGMLLSSLFSFLLSSHPQPWRILFAFGMVPTVVMGICLLLLPSSPRFLLMKGQIGEAKEILQVLWPENYNQEMEQMREGIRNEKSHRVSDLCRTEGNFHIRMLIGVGLVILQQFSGQPNILYYAPVLLRDVGFASTQSATLSNLAVGIVKFSFTVLVTLLVDRVGRRLLLTIGTAAMTVAVFVMVVTDLVWKLPLAGQLCGAASINNTINLTVAATSAIPPEVNNSRFLVLLALMIYVAAYSIGFGTVTWIILSEIYPSTLRGRAMSLATAVNWGANLIVSLTFLSLLNAVGVSVLFSFYTIICFGAVMFTIFLVPETKGNTLEEISQKLDQGHVCQKNCFSSSNG